MRTDLRSVIRLVIITAMLLATSFVLRGRSRVEVVPASALSSLPTAFGRWSSVDVPLGAEVREILGDGEFLSRNYVEPNTGLVNLFVAFFPSQRQGDAIHSPKNCLPGAGWIASDSGNVNVSLPGHPVIQANRYIVQKGSNRQLVIYWYQAHGRTLASEYAAKIYLVTDAVRLNRTDGALIRFITPIADGESSDSAEMRVLKFAQIVIPEIDGVLPR